MNGMVIRWGDFVAGRGPDVSASPVSAPLVVLHDVRVAAHDEFATDTFTASELHHATRFRSAVARREHLAGRAMVRTLVASHTGLAPEAVRIDAPPNEKPRIANPECAGIDVSVSHAAGRVACALVVSPGARVGVDIESLGHVGDVTALAGRVFSASESAALASVPEMERRRTFTRWWTRKEAVLKAAGVGLSVEPSSFDVVTDADAPMASQMSWVVVGGDRWACYSCSPEEDLELSVAWSPAATT